MQLSTKGRYAARALLDLALHYGEGPVRVKDISRRQELSDRYLEQILSLVKAAGFVRVVRGPRGGFTLAKPPEQIRLIDIVAVVEGSTAPVDCVDEPEICDRSPACAAREVWADVKSAIDGVLGSITLQSLADRQREIDRRRTHGENSR
jgi:Rrf2 family cysteine metabolism transcriptional repressor